MKIVFCCEINEKYLNWIKWVAFRKWYCMHMKSMELANVWKIINLKSLHKKRKFKAHVKGNYIFKKQLLSIILIQSQTAKGKQTENMKTFSEKVIKIIFWFNVTKILKLFFLTSTRARLEFHIAYNFFSWLKIFISLCACVFALVSKW